MNEHPSYTDDWSGDQHIADLVIKIKASVHWSSTVIVVTYDEMVGFENMLHHQKAIVGGLGHAY